MNDIFHEYMSKRLDEVNLNDFQKEAGPIVTLSRVVGCSARQLSAILAQKLNDIRPGSDWKVISKEILQESAKELELHPSKIKEIYMEQKRTLLDEIAQAFISNNDQLKRKFRNTVINIILRFAYEGNKIIIGRGSNSICSNIKRALHVRIDAPLDWRIQRLMNISRISREEALSFISQREKERASFRKSIKGKSVVSEDFDITINQSKFSDEESAQLIISALTTKGII